jgi:hypothetical protein
LAPERGWLDWKGDFVGEEGWGWWRLKGEALIWRLDPGIRAGDEVERGLELTWMGMELIWAAEARGLLLRNSARDDGDGREWSLKGEESGDWRLE